MQKTQKQAYYAGPHFLPVLTDQEVEDFKAERFHKLRSSAHVQTMEQMLNTAHSVDPTEIHGAILYYEGDEAMNSPRGGFALLGEDDDGEPYYKVIVFLDSQVEYEALHALNKMTKDQLVQERFRRNPPRSVL